MKDLERLIQQHKEHTEKQKKLELKLRVLGIAENVTRTYKLAKTFQLTPFQLELFKRYFASMYLTKSDPSPSVLRRRSPDEQTRTNVVIYELLHEAQEQVDHMKQDAASFAEERARDRGVEDADTITANASDHLLFIGSPEAIQRAAHKLSSTYVEQERAHSPSDEFQKAMSDTRDSIHLRIH